MGVSEERMSQRQNAPADRREEAPGEFRPGLL
jgi:hypothetical protein